MNEWVAVAYEQDFYVGQVEKLLSSKARVNFLAEDKGSFSWPHPKDKDDINAKFIFCRNVEVTKAGQDGTKFYVKNLQSIKDKFNTFCCEYF